MIKGVLSYVSLILNNARIHIAPCGFTLRLLALTALCETPTEAQAYHIAHITAVHPLGLVGVSVEQLGLVRPNPVLETMLPIKRKAEIAKAIRRRKIISIRLTVAHFTFKETPTIVNMCRQRQPPQISIGTSTPVEGREMMGVIVAIIETTVKTAPES